MDLLPEVERVCSALQGSATQECERHIQVVEPEFCWATIQILPVETPGILLLPAESLKAAIAVGLGLTREATSAAERNGTCGGLAEYIHGRSGWCLDMHSLRQLWQGDVANDCRLNYTELLPGP